MKVKNAEAPGLKIVPPKDGVYSTLFTPDVSYKDVVLLIEAALSSPTGDQIFEHIPLAATPKILKSPIVTPRFCRKMQSLSAGKSAAR